MHYLACYQPTDEARTYLELKYRANLAEFDHLRDPENDDLFEIFVDREMEAAVYSTNNEHLIWRESQ